MSVLIAFFTNSGAPATGLSPLPTMAVYDAEATLGGTVGSGNMYEIGGGYYGFDFTDVDGTVYAWVADGGTSVLDPVERQVTGSISGTTTARIEVDIPAIPTDVWAHDIRSVAGTGFVNAGQQVEGVRKLMMNGIRPRVTGSAAILDSFEDDDSTLFLSFTLLDTDANTVVAVAGQPGNRAKGA